MLPVPIVRPPIPPELAGVIAAFAAAMHVGEEGEEMQAPKGHLPRGCSDVLLLVGEDEQEQGIMRPFPWSAPTALHCGKRRGLPLVTHAGRAQRRAWRRRSPLTVNTLTVETPPPAPYIESMDRRAARIGRSSRHGAATLTLLWGPESGGEGAPSGRLPEVGARVTRSRHPSGVPTRALKERYPRGADPLLKGEVGMLALPQPARPVSAASAATTPATESPMLLQTRPCLPGALDFALKIVRVVAERGDAMLGREVEERYAPDAEEAGGTAGPELAPSETVEDEEHPGFRGEVHRRPVTGHVVGDLDRQADHGHVLSSDHSSPAGAAEGASVEPLSGSDDKTPPAPPPVRPRKGPGIAAAEGLPAMIVVADTTPFIHLARAGLLHLVPAVHGEVRVPRTVWRELVEARPDADDVPALLEAEGVWLHVEDGAEETDAFTELLDEVDAGEAAAIALAESLQAGLLLVDDSDARLTAEERSLEVQGSVGLLLAAKDARLLPAVQPALAALVATGFRLSPAVQARVLRLAGEE